MVGASHQRSHRIVHQRQAFDTHVVATVDGLLQQFYDVATDHVAAVEAFGPRDQRCRVEALLGAWEREGEAERVHRVGFVQLLGLHELGEALGDVVEELLARARHYRVGYEEHFRLDFDLTAVLKVDEEHAEVGAAQVEREELAELGG